MRGLALIAALTVLAPPAHALTPSQKPVVFSAAPQYAAPAATPPASTLLGYDNISTVTAQTNNITLPASSTYVPASGAAWWFRVEYRYDDSAGNTPSGTSPYTIIANCTAIGCSGGGDRYLQVENPVHDSTLTKQRELLFSAKQGSQQMWVTPCGASCVSTGIQLNAGTPYSIVVAQYASGAMSISANDTNGNPATGSPVMVATANNACGAGQTNFYCSAGTFRTPATIGNLFTTVGTSFTATNTYQNASTGPFADIAMVYGAFPNSSGTPDAPTLANLATGAKSVAQVITANGGTLNARYPLNNPNAVPPTSFAADATGTITTAATVNGGNTAAVIPGSPLASLPCLRLNEKGPYDIAPLDAGQTGLGVGTIEVSGTVNAASCGFTPRGVQAQITNIGTGAVTIPWTRVSLVGATFNGFLDGAPGSTPSVGCYAVSVRLTNSKTYAFNGKYPVCVGFTYLRIGQSQVNYMVTPGLSGTQLVGNGTLSQIVVALSDTGNVKSNHGAGQPSLVRITAQDNPGGGSAAQTAGDGIVEEAQDLSALLNNVPIKVVSIAKSGQGSDSWACDYTAQSAAMTGSGTGAYSITSLFTTADATQCGGPGGQFDGSIANVNTTGPQMSVLQGSVKLVDANGATVATESGGGTFTGANISAGGSLNYLSGLISGVTFTSSQASPLTAKWTLIEDTQAGTYVQQSPYVGFPTWGDGVSSSSGYATQVLNQNYQPFSAYIFEQCTADQGAIGSATPPTTNNSGYPLAWATKWHGGVLYGKLTKFPWSRANTPTVVLGYGRDANGIGNTAACRAALYSLGVNGAPTGLTGGNYVWGGSYYDDLTTCTASLCLSPHEGPYVQGARREGRRAACRLANLQASSACTFSQPTITSASRSGQTITFTVNLPNGGALTNCGTNLSGGSNTPSNSANNCSPPGTPVGTAVYGVRLGLSAATLYNYEGWSNLSSPTSVDDTKQFTCQIATATTFTCTSTGGWFTSGMYWAYAADQPVAEAGTAKPPSVAGTGYSGTGGNVTGTGGSCTTAPILNILQSSGTITATRVNVGAGCTATSTFAIPAGLTGGSGYAVTAGAWQPQDDFNHVGQLLYDNTGNCTISGTFEPGCLVTEVPWPQGPLS